MNKKLRLFILGIIGAVLLFNSSCKILENKDYGNYTSITLRVTATYKGLNSTGKRKLTLADVVRVNENFNIPGTVPASVTCDDMNLDKTHTLDVTITTSSMNIVHQYINWDYRNWSNSGSNSKALCVEWTGTVVSYQYEAGKDDPGSPVIGGFEILDGFNVIDHCTGGKVHQCSITATITFTSPNSSHASSRAGLAHAVSTSVKVADNN